MAAATVEMTAGRVSPKDLKVPLAAASAAGAKDVVITADCMLVFSTPEVRARIPFAGRAWEGEQNCRVNRAQFARTVRACKGADLLLEPSEDGLVVSSGALMVTLPFVEGQPVEHPDGQELLSIEARELARGLLRAAPFASRDQTRPLLCSVGLDLAAGTVVATDSYRLAAVEVPGLEAGDTPTLICPLSAIKPLAQVLATHAGDVTLSLAKEPMNQLLVVVVGDQRWTVTLRVGAYPEWRELLPAEGTDTTDFEMDAGELAKVASLIADAFAIGRTRHAPLVMDVTDGNVTVESRAPEGIKVRQHLDATGTVKDRLEMGFNPRFLCDAASAIAPDRAKITMVSPLRPMLAKAPDALFLVMPIRLTV
jgi:DNA polymerase III sliding clamp (beta) subunit (PCNA family)